jgi:hypothetical protein
MSAKPKEAWSVLEKELKGAVKAKLVPTAIEFIKRNDSWLFLVVGPQLDDIAVESRTVPQILKAIGDICKKPFNARIGTHSEHRPRYGPDETRAEWRDEKDAGIDEYDKTEGRAEKLLYYMEKYRASLLDATLDSIGARTGSSSTIREYLRGAKTEEEGATKFTTLNKGGEVYEAIKQSYNKAFTAAYSQPRPAWPLSVEEGRVVPTTTEQTAERIQLIRAFLQNADPAIMDERLEAEDGKPKVTVYVILGSGYLHQDNWYDNEAEETLYDAVHLLYESRRKAATPDEPAKDAEPPRPSKAPRAPKKAPPQKPASEPVVDDDEPTTTTSSEWPVTRAEELVEPANEEEARQRVAKIRQFLELNDRDMLDEVFPLDGNRKPKVRDLLGAPYDKNPSNWYDDGDQPPDETLYMALKIMYLERSDGAKTKTKRPQWTTLADLGVSATRPPAFMVRAAILAFLRLHDPALLAKEVIYTDPGNGRQHNITINDALNNVTLASEEKKTLWQVGNKTGLYHAIRVKYNEDGGSSDAATTPKAPWPSNLPAASGEETRDAIFEFLESAAPDVLDQKVFFRIPPWWKTGALRRDHWAVIRVTLDDGYYSDDALWIAVKDKNGNSPPLYNDIKKAYLTHIGVREKDSDDTSDDDEASRDDDVDQTTTAATTEQLKEEVRELRKDNRELAKQAVESDEVIRELEAVADASTLAEVRKGQEQRTHLKEDAERLRAQNGLLQRQAERAGEEAREANARVADVQQQLEEAKQAARELRQQLDDAPRRESSALLEDANRRNQELEARAQRLEREKLALVEQVKQLSDASTADESVKQRVSAQAAEIARLEQDLQRLQREMKDLEGIARETTRQHEAEKADLRRQLEEARGDVAAAQGANTIMAQRRAAAEEEARRERERARVATEQTAHATTEKEALQRQLRLSEQKYAALLDQTTTAQQADVVLQKHDAARAQRAEKRVAELEAIPVVSLARARGFKFTDPRAANTLATYTSLGVVAIDTTDFALVARHWDFYRQLRFASPQQRFVDYIEARPTLAAPADAAKSTARFPRSPAGHFVFRVLDEEAAQQLDETHRAHGGGADARLGHALTLGDHVMQAQLDQALAPLSLGNNELTVRFSRGDDDDEVVLGFVAARLPVLQLAHGHQVLVLDMAQLPWDQLRFTHTSGMGHAVFSSQGTLRVTHEEAGRRRTKKIYRFEVPPPPVVDLKYAYGQQQVVQLSERSGAEMLVSYVTSQLSALQRLVLPYHPLRDDGEEAAAAVVVLIPSDDMQNDQAARTALIAFLRSALPDVEWLALGPGDVAPSAAKRLFVAALKTREDLEVLQGSASTQRYFASVKRPAMLVLSQAPATHHEDDGRGLAIMLEYPQGGGAVTTPASDPAVARLRRFATEQASPYGTPREPEDGAIPVEPTTTTTPTIVLVPSNVMATKHALLLGSLTEFLNDNAPDDFHWVDRDEAEMQGVPIPAGARRVFVTHFVDDGDATGTLLNDKDFQDYAKSVVSPVVLATVGRDQLYAHTAGRYVHQILSSGNAIAASERVNRLAGLLKQLSEQDNGVPRAGTTQALLDISAEPPTTTVYEIIEFEADPADPVTLSSLADTGIDDDDIFDAISDWK